MPDEAARQIFAKYGFGWWLDSPYLEVERLCGGGKVKIEMRDIDQVFYGRQEQRLLLVGGGLKHMQCAHTIAFGRMTEAEASDLATALRVLGAQIDELRLVSKFSLI